MQRLLFLVFLGAAGALALRQYVVEGVYIATGSMEPTLPVGRHVLVNKWVYRFQTPQRGEIVVFPDPTSPKDLVKRLVAVAGDEIQIENKKVILNGRELKEPYVQYTRPNERLVGDNMSLLRVPPAHVFAMGDNRDQSEFYLVRNENLKGRLIGIP